MENHQIFSNNSLPLPLNSQTTSFPFLFLNFKSRPFNYYNNPLTIISLQFDKEINNHNKSTSPISRSYSTTTTPYLLKKSASNSLSPSRNPSIPLSSTSSTVQQTLPYNYSLQLQLILQIQISYQRE